MASAADRGAILGASPSRKSVQRVKDNVGEQLKPPHVEPWPDVRDQLNRILRGWSNDFGHGTRLAAYTAIDRPVHDRVRDVQRDQYYQ